MRDAQRAITTGRASPVRCRTGRPRVAGTLQNRQVLQHGAAVPSLSRYVLGTAAERTDADEPRHALANVNRHDSAPEPLVLDERDAGGRLGRRQQLHQFQPPRQLLKHRGRSDGIGVGRRGRD